MSVTFGEFIYMDFNVELFISNLSVANACVKPGKLYTMMLVLCVLLVCIFRIGT